MNGLKYKGRFVGEGDGVTLFNSMDFSTTTGGGIPLHCGQRRLTPVSA